MTPIDNQSMERMKEIEGRLEKATKGPWFLWLREPMSETDSGGYDVSSKPDDRILADFHQPNAQANREFVAHSRTDIEYLLSRLKAAEEALDEIHDVRVGDKTAVHARDEMKSIAWQYFVDKTATSSEGETRKEKP